MNKTSVAIFVAVLAITLIEFSAARRGGKSRESGERHRKGRQNCSTTNDGLEANLRCAAECYASSNRTQWGNCQNKTCTCYARGPVNNATDVTIGRRSVISGVNLPVFGDGKKHNIHFGVNPETPGDGKKHNIQFGVNPETPGDGKKHNIHFG